MWAPSYEDPRDDGRFPARGLVDVWHADKRSVAAVRAEGVSVSEGDVVWVASGPEIAELNAAQYVVESLARLRIEAADLHFERSHDDLHLFFCLKDARIELISVSEWPEALVDEAEGTVA